MEQTTILGFLPPPDFPAETYNKVNECINKYIEKHKASYRVPRMHFGLGWNGVGYRYRAMLEYDKEFICSICRSKNFPSHEELYNQEKALIGFFTNAVSVIECFFFSSYCIASIIKPSKFMLEKDANLRFYPNDVKETFISSFKNDHFTEQLISCCEASNYIQMKNIRNVLSHRGIIPRNIHMGGDNNGLITMPSNPQSLSNQWKLDFPRDENTTSQFRKWLSNTLNELVESCLDFCTRQLP